MGRKTKEILIESLRPFREHYGQTYEGERLMQLARSIETNGLLNPIIVRSVDNDQYEIICGHNRTKAMKVLGRDTITAEVRELSDEEATAAFYESNLNQQSFSDWSYSQRIKAVKYSEKKIQEYSQQGKRNDILKKKEMASSEETSVQNRQKLTQKTTRDKMARRLGISTATLSKYRRIIKLSDELLNSIARLLDERKISLEVAYIIANKRSHEITWFVEYRDKYPNLKIDLVKLKKLPTKDEPLAPINKEKVREVFIREDDDIIPIKRKG